MKKFSEHSGGIQLAQILGIMTFLFGAGGSFMLWAADAKIDEKYATDEDVLAVQNAVEAQVTIIQETVTENTTTVRATANSVDGLTLVVLGLQISDLESEIIDLEAEKRAQAAGWNERDERRLRDHQRALEDFERQRSVLLNRLLADQDDDP